MNAPETYYKFLSELSGSLKKSSDEIIVIILKGLTMITGNNMAIAFEDCTGRERYKVLASWNLNNYMDQDLKNEFQRLIESEYSDTETPLKTPLLVNSSRYFNPTNKQKHGDEPEKLLLIPYLNDENQHGSVVLSGRSGSYSDSEINDFRFLIAHSMNIYFQSRQIEDLKRESDKATEGEKLKNLIMVNISHEIRTPVNAIVGFSNLLDESDLPEDLRKKYIDIILKSSNELLTIIDDASEISSLESNLNRTTLSETNVKTLSKEIIARYIKEADGKGIILAYNSDLDREKTLIMTDRYKLSYIINSLVSNAMKLTYSGKIIISTFITGNMIHFNVTDTGRGIPVEYHERIFDYLLAFENIMARKVEGPEIGIAISHTYVKHLGGEMWFNSKEGEGTVFSFTLPYIKTEHPFQDSGRFREESLTPKSKKVILVAEDDDNNFSLIEHILRKENIRLLRAINGKKAVDICKSEDIDLVLMDIKMPEMDGYMATKLIKEVKPNQKIIAQTAFISDRNYAISCGCVDFIAKPFGKQQLLSIINNYLQ
jgi:signal transduction histidine kinase